MWTRCSQGHTHWGRRGAAGLLVRHHAPDAVRYLLQHRALVVHHGDTWGIPGGAIEPGESPQTAAWREAQEELEGLALADLIHAGTHVDDHGGGWSYSTIVMDAPEMFVVSGTNFETGPDGCRWMTADQARSSRLHPGLAASWDKLLSLH